LHLQNSTIINNQKTFSSKPDILEHAHHETCGVIKRAQHFTTY